MHEANVLSKRTILHLSNPVAAAVQYICRDPNFAPLREPLTFSCEQGEYGGLRMESAEQPGNVHPSSLVIFFISTCCSFGGWIWSN
jgi:hypothetical protein